MLEAGRGIVVRNCGTQTLKYALRRPRFFFWARGGIFSWLAHTHTQHNPWWPRLFARTLAKDLKNLIKTPNDD